MTTGMLIFLSARAALMLPCGEWLSGVIVQMEYLPDLIEEFWLLTFCRIRHIKTPYGMARPLITGIGQNCPKNRLLSHYQGKMAS